MLQGAAQQQPVETFSALAALPGVCHAFCGRWPGIDAAVDRAAALAKLSSHHDDVRAQLGLKQHAFVTAEQVHGSDVAVVDSTTQGPVPGVDGLISADPKVCLGIYVADCCAVYLVDPKRRVIGLLHSGRKGSELGIVGAALHRMQAEFGCKGEDVCVQLSPCIRPPHFEVDFAEMIRNTAAGLGVTAITDCGTCTARNLASYYSYRAERGKTGRMVALLALT